MMKVGTRTEFDLEHDRSKGRPTYVGASIETLCAIPRMKEEGFSILNGSQLRSQSLDLSSRPIVSQNRHMRRDDELTSPGVTKGGNMLNLLLTLLNIFVNTIPIHVSPKVLF